MSINTHNNNMDSIKISALIFTKDNVDRCIKLCQKLKHFVDEIVIIDSSSRKNYEFLRKKLIKIIDKIIIINLPPIGYADPYHQIGLNLASYDWILNIDDDEEPDIKLLLDLKNIILKYKHYKCFKIIRIDLKNNMKIRIPRLFNKKFILMTGIIHQSRIPKVICYELDDKYFILHYNQVNFKKYLKKLHTYALIESYQWGYKLLYYIYLRDKENNLYNYLKYCLKKLISLGLIGWLIALTLYNLSLLIYKIYKQPKDSLTFLLTCLYHLLIQYYLLQNFKMKIKISQEIFKIGSLIKFLGLDDLKNFQKMSISLGNNGLNNFIKLIEYKYEIINKLKDKSNIK